MTTATLFNAACEQNMTRPLSPVPLRERRMRFFGAGTAGRLTARNLARAG